MENRQKRIVVLMTLAILTTSLSGCVNITVPPPDFTGSFEMTIIGIGGYGVGTKFGDAFIKLEMKGQLLAWNQSSPSQELYKIALNITAGKLTIKYYYSGKWDLKSLDLTGQKWAWQDDQVSGLITGGTWTAKGNGISFNIAWNEAFTSGRIRGSVRGTFDVDSMPLKIGGRITGTATNP